MEFSLLALISLLGLIAIIIIGMKTNVNCGILGIAYAFILGFFIVTQTSNGVETVVSSALMGGKPLRNSFGTNLFLSILGVSLLFGVARVNGTLELGTHKLVALCGGRKWLMPIVFYLAAVFLSAIGAGSIAVLALICPLAASVAFEEGISYTLMLVFAGFGGAAGGMSPLAPTGIVAVNTAASVGLDIGSEVFWRFLAGSTIFFLGGYIYFKGWKLGRSEKKNTDIPKFNGKQWFTLIVIVLFCLTTLFLKLDVISVSILGTAILLIGKAANEKEVLKTIPWATLILVTGMGMAINMVNLAGGIDLLTGFFSSFMNKYTAAPLYNLLGGAMSFVSSASGVVMPTRIPTTPDIAASTGASTTAMITALSFGAHMTAQSPFSTGGGIMLGLAGDRVDQNQLFKTLLICCGLGLVLGCILCLVGVFG